jgi:pyrrolysine biosynthesis protein PylC
MTVALIGGKLQGIEAAYLAKKAGLKVVLIDKKPDVPARGLADEFYQYDVTRKEKRCSKILGEADLIIPSLEDNSALEAINETAKEYGVPFAYDPSSYAVSQSKNKSNQLFTGLGFQVPEKWPGCGLPAMCKPSHSSGSRGVKKITSAKDMDAFLREISENRNGWLIQEYLEGPSYSLEVIGWKGSFSCIQVTKIEVDGTYDCKRVTAPSGLPGDLEKELKKTSVKIAGGLDLYGIMDIEVIHSNTGLKILEIDARLPSQTPTVVYHSTGINMVEMLAGVFCENVMPDVPEVKNEKPVIFEHVKACFGQLESGGEHIMSEAGAVKCIENFFGADEAVTDYKPGSTNWAATLIIKENSPDDAWKKRSSVLKDLTKTLNLTISNELKEKYIFESF